jgi:hypothetical protein
MRKYLGYALFLLLLLAVSCKKQDGGWQIEQKIKRVIESEKIERVWATTENYNPANGATLYGDWGTNYSFDKPMMTIEGATYNLLLLKNL